jgi:FkbM family methyltransferase
MKEFINIKKRSNNLFFFKYGVTFKDKIKLFIAGILLQLPRRLILYNGKYFLFLNSMIKFSKIKIHNNIFLLNSIDDMTLHLQPNYESNIQDWFTKYYKSGVLIDVGANVGRYSITYASNAKKVICFEPSPETRRILLKNILLNKLNNVEVYPFALWYKNGYELFEIYPHHQGMNSIVNKEKGSNIIKVKTIKLDDLRLNIREIDVIKIDVEGAEFEALHGMKDTIVRYKPAIVIEIKNKNKDLVNNFLNKIGYDMIQTKNDNYLFKPSIGYEKLEPIPNMVEQTINS